MFQTGQAPTRHGGLECGSSSYRLPISVHTSKLGKAKVRKAVAAATALQDVLANSGGRAKSVPSRAPDLPRLSALKGYPYELEGNPVLSCTYFRAMAGNGYPRYILKLRS